MIVVEDEGKPPVTWGRYAWARGKRRMFMSPYDVARQLCEHTYPDEMYRYNVLPDKTVSGTRWDKAW